MTLFYAPMVHLHDIFYGFNLYTILYCIVLYFSVLWLQDVSVLVVCMAGVSWMDITAGKQLAALYKDYNGSGITMAFAGANGKKRRFYPFRYRTI